MLHPLLSHAGATYCFFRPHEVTLIPASLRSVDATRTSCGCGANWKKVTRLLSSTYVWLCAGWSLGKRSVCVRVFGLRWRAYVLLGLRCGVCVAAASPGEVCDERHGGALQRRLHRDPEKSSAALSQQDLGASRPVPQPALQSLPHSTGELSARVCRVEVLSCSPESLCSFSWDWKPTNQSKISSKSLFLQIQNPQTSWMLLLLL